MVFRRQVVLDDRRAVLSRVSENNDIVASVGASSEKVNLLIARQRWMGRLGC